MHQPRQNIREAVTGFIRTHFTRARTDTFSPHAKLLEEGIVDSMGLLDIIGFLENSFGIRVTEDDLVTDNFGSVDALVGYVERQLGKRQPNTTGSREDDEEHGSLGRRTASSG